MKFLGNVESWSSGLSARVDDGIHQEIAAYVPTHRRRNIPTREICQTRRAEVSVRFYKSLRIIVRAHFLAYEIPLSPRMMEKTIARQIRNGSI